MRRWLVLTLLLAGCATNKPVGTQDFKAEIRKPPAECMLACDPLTPPKGATLADTYEAAVGAALNQKECAKRHACLVEWVNGTNR